MGHRKLRHMTEQGTPVLNATEYQRKIWCFIMLFGSGCAVEYSSLLRKEF